ncbi:helix-turn-helix domain-containing protein [Nonomuraea sp. NPDC050663]|uniref:helix-turn-helix domain-containing protein n=1 Tax=Nonomuraea sp. NPDC050663 TaxID=3364370 RepID=UPI0037A3A5C6
MSHTQPVDLDTLFTAEEAAAEVGVARQTIYVWVNRGYLKHAAKQGHLKLFRLEDVFEAEKSRDRSRRRKV